MSAFRYEGHRFDSQLIRENLNFCSVVVLFTVQQYKTEKALVDSRHAREKERKEEIRVYYTAGYPQREPYPLSDSSVCHFVVGVRMFCHISHRAKSQENTNFLTYEFAFSPGRDIKTLS